MTAAPRPESADAVAGRSSIHIAWDAAVDGWRQLARLPSALNVFAWERIGDADCFWWTGQSGVLAHQIFLTTAADEVVQTLDTALSSPLRGAACDVVIRGIDTPEFASALTRRAVENASIAPFMMCDLTHRDPISPQPFATSTVSTQDQQAELLAMVSGVYGDVGGLTAFFQGIGATQIIGVYDRDRLISSATIVRSRTTANIWSVATAASDRGRGAATAAVLAALDHATKAGCTTASLSTSDHLARWYGRLGFTEVGREYTATIRAQIQGADSP